MLSVHQVLTKIFGLRNHIYFLPTYSKVHVFCIFFLSLDLNRISSILPEFKDNLFAFSHSAIDFRSWLIFLFVF